MRNAIPSEENEMYKTANATQLYPVSPKLLMQPHYTRVTQTANATPLDPVSPKLLIQPHSTRCHPNC